jgi:ATP-dependent DNA helicase RecG
MVEIFENRIEITNPGGLVKGLTPENFGKISKQRNPGIANLFQQIDYIEKMGPGIERIRLALKEADVPMVQYEFNPYYLKAVFPRQTENREKTSQEITQESGEKVGRKLGEKLNKNERSIMEKILQHPHITIQELAEEIGISTTAIENNLSKLKEKGYLRRIGSDKRGRWEVIKGVGNE